METVLTADFPFAGISVAALAIQDDNGERRARTAISVSAASDAPGGEFVRVDYDTAQDKALLLSLLYAALRVAEPFVKSRLEVIGVEFPVPFKVLPGEPSNGINRLHEGSPLTP